VASAVWASSPARGAPPLASRMLRAPASLAGTAGHRPARAAPPLERLQAAADHSWVERLTPDPDAKKHAPNKVSREVRSGHYVPVEPTPLPRPELVAASGAMARSLGLSAEEVAQEDLVRFLSGEQSLAPAMRSWATPYALSIMGQRHTSNCPFGNGNGYGDGRAVSVGEVVVEGQRWELQLKGGGRTPFCRGADGRAVLRSSVREFLASEHMHALGISTTRALSLVVSGQETSRRPWYSGADPRAGLPSLDDPRLARYPIEVRRQILDQVARESRDPDTLVEEKCAITTRVAPSFLRVGHVDLFFRRAGRDPRDGEARRQLEQIVEHALFREYPELCEGLEGAPLGTRAAAMLRAFAGRLGAMAAGWLRVGFCQGNFNADNCLVGGRTMDYGPFGFLERYDPLFAKWTGSGEHFAFLNQPNAALANFYTLATSVAPLLDGGEAEAEAIVNEASAAISAAVADTWRAKLGLPQGEAGVGAAESLWEELEPVMRRSAVDWTLTWRQLAAVAALPPGASDAELLEPLTPAFHEPPSEALRQEWAAFMRRWLAALGGADRTTVVAAMNAANPKYVAREWMLVEAYDRAARGDYSEVRALYDLLLAPYDEGTAEQQARYYRRAPEEALTKGGTAFMT